MPWELRIGSNVKTDMLACDDEARSAIRDFVAALEENAFPAGCETLGRHVFFSRLRCGYFISWETILDSSKPLSITDPPLAAVRVLGVGKIEPRKRGK